MADVGEIVNERTKNSRGARNARVTREPNVNSRKKQNLKDKMFYLDLVVIQKKWIMQLLS